jgi:hypothetical protein
MNTNTILKWLVLPASTLTIIGCGGGSSSTPSSVATGQAFYIDSAVQGVDYSCGTQTGITGSKGEFTFDVGHNCTFSLDKIKLRDVAADTLENGKQIQETKVDIARVLLSLDSDRNPDNGITIDRDIVASLVDAGVSTFADIFNEWSTIIPIEWPSNILTDLVSESVAKAHLVQNILQEHTLYTNILGQSNTLESWTFNADLSSVTSVELVGGNDTETITLSFDRNTLTFNSSENDPVVIQNITDEYLIIIINGEETRLYYDELKAKDYFLQ